MRRINRGLFQVTMSQVALENQVVGPTETPKEDVVVSPAETPANTGTVEVTVKVDTEEPVVIEKTEGDVVPQETTTVPEVTAAVSAEVTEPVETVVTEETDAEKKIKELEAEIARLKSGTATTESVETESPAEETPVVPEAVETPVESTPADAVVTDTSSTDTTTAEPTETAVSEGETVLVKTEGGDVVATVNTTETGTTVTTSEVTVEVEKTGDSTSVEVTVTPDETSVISTEDMTVIETDGNEVEVEIQDAVDCAEDTAELVNEIDEAEEAAMTLESFAEIASAAAGNGGLDSNGARLLKVATEHIYNHMSLGKAVGIPAMESFEIPGARASATTIALEDIREQAKKVWAAIVEGIKKAAQWIQEFITKIFSANARIKSTAEKLLAVTGKMSGAPKAKMVGNAALVKSLTSGGRISSDLAKEVQKVTEFLDSAIDGRTFNALEKVITVSREALFKGGTDQLNSAIMAAIKTISDKGLQFNNVANSLAAKVGIEGAPTGTTMSMTPRFPGEQVVWAYIPTSAESAALFRAGIGVDSVTVKIADDAKAITLTPTQIAEVSKQVIHYVEVSEKLNKLQGPLKELLGVVNSLVSVTKKVDGNVTVPETKVILPALRAVRQLVKGIHQPAAVVASRVVNASLRLAAESAKQYTMKAA